MACSHSKDCQLYPQFAADPSLKLWQQHYCEADFSQCARYQAAAAGKPIPLTLLPNGQLLHRHQSKEELGANALFNAIQKNRVHMVKSFINRKVSSAVIQTADGTTPLMAAAEQGNAEIVKLLLDAGCSPLHKNNQGKTALDIASRKGFTSCEELIRSFMQRQAASAVSRPQPTQETSIMSGILSFLRKRNPTK